MIEIKDETIVEQSMERQFKIIINNKEVWVDK